MANSTLNQLEQWLQKVIAPEDSSSTLLAEPLELKEIELSTCEKLAQSLSQALENLLLAQKLHVSLFLNGPLGVGKTTLCQSLIGSLAKVDKESIESPTYTYLIPYQHSKGWPILHFDLYRLASAEQLLALGLDEYWQAPGLSLIEWPSCAQSLAPWPRLKIDLRYKDLHSRQWQMHWQPQPIDL